MEAPEPPSRFNQLAERLAAARRSQQRPSARPDDDRLDDAETGDDDDERPLGDPGFDPRANVPRRYAPAAPPPAERDAGREEPGMQAADPDGTTEADGAFVIRPRISAKQASELAYSDTPPTRTGKLPLLSPAQP